MTTSRKCFIDAQQTLEEIRASGEFDFAVLQATMASVSFYEELGFVRVGAIAKYFPEGTSLESKAPLPGPVRAAPCRAGQRTERDKPRGRAPLCKNGASSSSSMTGW